MADVLFVGVTTGGSLVHRAMPLWQPLLPSPVRVRGVDVHPQATPARYVKLLDDICDDPDAAGAVVSAHKIRLFDAARERFDELDPIALACGEVNAVRRDGSSLRGYARDPVSVGRVADEIWPERTGDVVCLGAGGTALALAFHLASTGTPGQLVCADRDPAALERLTRRIAVPVATHLGEGPWDDLVAAAPPGSLIVDATGMGKDRPGSPTSDRVRFPDHAVVWELNYRGDLRFLRLARAQAADRRLHVHDGWTLFCYEPFVRSDYTLRLLAAPAVETYAGFRPGSMSAVNIRYKELWGDQGAQNDRLLIDGLNVCNATLCPISKQVNAFFAFDRNRDGQTDLSSPDPVLGSLPFIQGGDVYVPASSPPDGTATWQLDSRGGGRIRTLKVPNWDSATDGVTLQWNDFERLTF